MFKPSNQQPANVFQERRKSGRWCTLNTIPTGEQYNYPLIDCRNEGRGWSGGLLRFIMMARRVSRLSNWTLDAFGDCHSAAGVARRRTCYRHWRGEARPALWCRWRWKGRSFTMGTLDRSDRRHVDRRFAFYVEEQHLRREKSELLPGTLYRLLPCCASSWIFHGEQNVVRRKFA